MIAEETVNKAVKQLAALLYKENIPVASVDAWKDDSDACITINDIFHVSVGFYDGVLYNVGKQVEGIKYEFSEFSKPEEVVNKLKKEV